MIRRIWVLTCFMAVSASCATAQQLRFPPVVHVDLPNGIRLVLMEYHRAPTLNVAAVFAGGKVTEPADKKGIADLTTTLMRRGTETRSANRIAEEIDFLGGSLSISVGYDKSVATLSVLARDADAGLDVFADVLRNPKFAPDELERERAHEVAELQAIGESPGAVADRITAETIYGRHPYGGLATIRSLQSFADADVRAYYRANFAPDRMLVVAVGDFKSDEMADRLKARFGNWTKTGAPLPDAPVAEPSAPRIVLIDKPDATQTQVRFARIGVPRNTPDYFPIELADTILGGGFTSRLVDQIRINRSLTYGIGSIFTMRKQGGDFSVSTFTKIETTRRIIDATRDVLKQTAKKGFTEAELRKVKGYLAGQFAINAQTPEALTGQLISIAFYGLPEDYLRTYIEKLRAVSLADVNRIARTYFNPGAMSLILVAPEAAVKSQLNGIAGIETRPIASVGK